MTSATVLALHSKTGTPIIPYSRNLIPTTAGPAVFRLEEEVKEDLWPYFHFASAESKIVLYPSTPRRFHVKLLGPLPVFNVEPIELPKKAFLFEFEQPVSIREIDGESREHMHGILIYKQGLCFRPWMWTTSHPTIH